VKLKRFALLLAVLAFHRSFGAGPGLGRVDVRELLWFCILQVSLIITLIEIIALFYDLHLQTVLRKRRRAG
jgi:hypothetical protein